MTNKTEQETAAEIAAEIRRDRKPYALKVAARLENSTTGDRVLREDAATCLRDDCHYLYTLATRIDNADIRRQMDIMPTIARLVKDGILLRESDERNGKPYKVFGEKLADVYFRLAAQIYRASGISRVFWLKYLSEHDSDPKGMARQMSAILRTTK